VTSVLVIGVSTLAGAPHSGVRMAQCRGPISLPWPRGSVTRFETVYQTYAYLMPDADNRGCKAMDQFFRRPGGEPSALDVRSDGRS
jgi:hypothetical protein